MFEPRIRGLYLRAGYNTASTVADFKNYLKVVDTLAMFIFIFAGGYPNGKMILLFSNGMQ